MREKELEKTKNRILSLCEDNNLEFPSMDAQTALNELCDHLLGEDFYIAMPLGVKQCNAEIVYEIETKYKRVGLWKKYLKSLKKRLKKEEI